MSNGQLLDQTSKGLSGPEEEAASKKEAAKKADRLKAMADVAKRGPGESGVKAAKKALPPRPLVASGPYEMRIHSGIKILSTLHPGYVAKHPDDSQTGSKDVSSNYEDQDPGSASGCESVCSLLASLGKTLVDADTTRRQRSMSL